MKNLPKKYIESMMDAQSQIIAQQKEIEQLKVHMKKVVKIARGGMSENTKLKEEKEALTVVCSKINDYRQEISNLSEEIRILKQYAEIARNDKHQRKVRLNEALEEIKELKK